MTPGPKFIREARVRFEQHARLRQSNCLRRSDPAGVDSAPPLPLRLTRFYRGSDVKRFPQWRRYGAGLARGRAAIQAQSMPIQREQRVARERDRSSISYEQRQQNFFSERAARSSAPYHRSTPKTQQNAVRKADAVWMQGWCGGHRHHHTTPVDCRNDNNVSAKPTRSCRDDNSAGWWSP